jgi:hypothetical protein
VATPPRPDASLAPTDAEHTARVALGLEAIWPIALIGFLAQLLQPPVGNGFLDQMAPLLIGMSTAVAAIVMARRARAMGPSRWARVARVLGWTEVVLSVTVFIVVVVIMMEQLSHETL